MSQWDPDDDDLVGELPAPARKSIPEADRELLHLAARAIGAVRVDDIEGEQWLSLHFSDGTVTHGWNALLFYSDTFELQVKLNLHVEVDCETAGCVTIQWDFGDSTTAAGVIEERAPEGGDDCAATARAIVRAAAEIGKQRA